MDAHHSFNTRMHFKAATRHGSLGTKIDICLDRYFNEIESQSRLERKHVLTSLMNNG